jgi:hypothetical protein
MYVISFGFSAGVVDFEKGNPCSLPRLFPRILAMLGAGLAKHPTDLLGP